MARKRIWVWGGPSSGLTYTEQAQLWRAAAKGHLANGRKADSDAALENARMIERTCRLRFAPTNGREDQHGNA